MICSFLLLAQKKEPKKKAAKTITPHAQGLLCPACLRVAASAKAGRFGRPTLKTFNHRFGLIAIKISKIYSCLI
jgi:hypothetical protein